MLHELVVATMRVARGIHKATPVPKSWPARQAPRNSLRNLDLY
jgi:hypothetical protein